MIKNNKIISIASVALTTVALGASAYQDTLITRPQVVKATAQDMSGMPKGMAITKGTEMPGEYSYHPRIIPGITKVHAFGKGVKYNFNATNDETGKLEEYAVFDTDDPATIAAKGRMGVYYENTGMYQGHQVDTKVTILDWDVPNGGGNFQGKPGNQHRIGIGTTFFGLDEPGGYPSTVTRLRIDNIDHQTGEPVKVKGYYSFMDIDGGQAIGIDSQTMKKISTVYYTPDTHMVYKPAQGDYSVIAGYDSVTRNDNYGGVSFAYDDTSSLTFDWYSTGIDIKHGDPLDLGPKKNQQAANEIAPKLSSNYDASAGKDVAEISGSVPFSSFHGSWIEYGAQAILPHKPDKPHKYVSDSDEGTDNPSKIGLINKSVDHNTLKNRYESYHYQITHSVPEEKSEFYYKSYEITDKLDKILESPTNIKVYDEQNQDVTYRFTVNVDNNELKVIAKPSTLTQSDFYGNNYKVTFDTKVKPGVSLANHVDPEHKDQALIKNKPTVTVDDDSVDGNTTKTNIPFVPDNTDKRVSTDGNGDTTKLDVDFGKEYKYRVDADVPDNVNVTSLELTDQLEKVQDIKDVKVYDYDDKDSNGKPRDITDQGKLTTDDNLVDWKANTPSKWHGKHIKMFITATVRNTPDLLKYLDKDNTIKIPNEAHFKFNDKDKVTNKTEVTPNTPPASVSKKIEVSDDSTGSQIDKGDLDKQTNKTNESTGVKSGMMFSFFKPLFNLFQ